MELLDWLKENYQWRNVKFVNEALIETDHGQKRLRYWSDKALLDWHITWRDECSVTPYMLADRMIRNKDQEAAIEWKDGWVTVHDEVDQQLNVVTVERKVAQMIGAMIGYGLETATEVRKVSSKEPQFRSLYSQLPYVKEKHKTYIRSLLQESEYRMNKAKALKKQVTEEKLPVIDPFESTDQAKKVYDVMIWFGTKHYPEEGYSSLRTFLGKWFDEYGKDSVIRLVTEIVDHDKVSRDQALYLLIECLQPYELDHLTRVTNREATNQEIEEALEQVTKDWERSKELVQVISSVIDEKKKVLPQ
ncbi:hypothetical protein N0O92_04605 [Alkalihalobacillus sp. MEB130]|uniref:hypothetical protein n=1 Tax=Alkalihalobacillus sp. MEB130 TaxID=2976704 RepID=UPI0028DFE81D|nr:hypothetical protein [Alkalihalobacillus sp. MEB130]MDT8859504.1 hypothetical protein [Alkalihalobacillus sp. MEB130]